MATEPFRIGVSGCGAVTQIYYGPAIASLEDQGAVHSTLLFDPDVERARSAKAIIRGAQTVDTFDDLLSADLIIVASPPAHHKKQVGTALAAGRDVLCEKPLALTAHDASFLAGAAVTAGRVLAVNHVRRHLATTRTIKRLLDQGTIGTVHSFSAFEGGPFSWPLNSSSYFAPGQGGGIVHDIGTHVLDLLLWWLGDPGDVSLESDAMGGVEANCLIDLSYPACRGSIRLSRDWFRPNQLVLNGDLGSIVWEENETERLTLRLGGAPPITTELRVQNIDRMNRLQPPPTFCQAFALAITDAVAAARGVYRPVATADDAMRVATIIDAALKTSRPMKMGWLSADEVCAQVRLARA